MNTDFSFPLTNRQFVNEHGNIESIIFADPDSVVMSGDMAKTKKRLLSREKFRNQLRNQKLFTRHVTLASHTKLEPYQIERRDERLKIIEVLKKLVDEGYRPTTLATYTLLKERVQKLYPEYGGDNFRGKSTICKWWKTWQDKSGDNDALCGVKRHRSNNLSASTEAHLEHYVATTFSGSQSNIIKNHYNAYVADAIEMAKSNPSLVPASERTFYRRISGMATLDQLLKNKDLPPKIRNRLLLTCQQKIRTFAPLQRVEADRMVTTMVLRDDKTGETVGPVSLYFAIDAYTRAILGIIMSYGAEKAEDVLNLIRHCVLPDPNSPCKGIPRVLICDNGSGFNNELMIKLSQRMGTQLTFAPSDSPQKKPFIESFNDKVRKEFFEGFKVHHPDGTVTIGFNSYRKKRRLAGDDLADIKSVADVYESDFKEALAKYIISYNNTPHQSLNNKTPVEVWLEETEKRPDLLCMDFDSITSSFHVMRGKTDTVINHNGSVRCNKMDFYAREMKDFYLENSKYVGKKLTLNCATYGDWFDCRSITAVVTEGHVSREITLTNTNADIAESPVPVSFFEALGKTQSSIPIKSNVVYDVDSKDFDRSIRLTHLFSEPKKKTRSDRPRKNARPLFNELPLLSSAEGEALIGQVMSPKSKDDARSISKPLLNDDELKKEKAPPPSKFESDDEPDLF